MKIQLTAAALMLAMAAPALAETSAAELFAMSNNSAAETIVSETSMGDVTAARIKLALNNMSPAERKAFFESDVSTRQQIIGSAVLFGDGNSAAEMAAEIERATSN